MRKKKGGWGKGEMKNQIRNSTISTEPWELSEQPQEGKRAQSHHSVWDKLREENQAIGKLERNPVLHGNAASSESHSKLR